MPHCLLVYQEITHMGCWKNMETVTEMPTSGDLKSWDSLFFTTPRNFNRPHPPWQIDPASNGNDLGHYKKSYMKYIISRRQDATVSFWCHFSLSPPNLAFLMWGDLHARSRFARSTIPEEIWGLLVVFHRSNATNNLCQWLNTYKNAPETILRIRKIQVLSQKWASKDDFIRQIILWWPVWESRRSVPYHGDSRIIRESWHVCS